MATAIYSHSPAHSTNIRWWSVSWILILVSSIMSVGQHSQNRCCKYSRKVNSDQRQCEPTVCLQNTWTGLRTGARGWLGQGTDHSLSCSAVGITQQKYKCCFCFCWKLRVEIKDLRVFTHSKQYGYQFVFPCRAKSWLVLLCHPQPHTPVCYWPRLPFLRKMALGKPVNLTSSLWVFPVCGSSYVCSCTQP